MQFRIPFLPSLRRKPCSEDELLDEDTIFLQCVGCDVVAFQIVQMNVSSYRNHFFRRSDGHSTLVHFLPESNGSRCDFVPIRDILGEHDFQAVNQVTVSRFDRGYDNQNVIIAVDPQQLSICSLGLHQNFPYCK